MSNAHIRIMNFILLPNFFHIILICRCTRKVDGELPLMEEFCGIGGTNCDDNTTIVSYMSTFCVKGLVCEGNATIPGGSTGSQICNAVSLLNVLSFYFFIAKISMCTDLKFE